MDLYMMNCELLATCSALGYLESDTYHKEPDCLESVKDLIRYLRHEDDTRDIRQQLGAAQILQNDLIPLVIQHHNDKQLFDAVIRLMVNVTQPALLCFGKVPQDPTFRHHFLQVVSYLQAYKEAFANERLFGVLSEKLYDLLQMEWEQREEEHNLLIERILLLVRNILHVPPDPEEEKSVDDDASIHDRVLWAIHMSGMDDLIKFLASSETEQQWSMHVLETVSLMFRDQIAEHLAATGQARSTAERDTDIKNLEILRQRESAEKKNRALQRGTRHSRFGGSYIVQGLKSIGDKDVIYHKGIHNFKNYTHDLGKEVRRVPKRKQQAKETEARRRSALNVRLFLKEFCIDFLENCYNRLMYIVKDNLIREKAQQHDETYYLWSMAFFMGFNRLFRFQPELVSETVSIRTFHFIEQNLTNYYEMMLTDKKEATSWARRMHLALKAYQELLSTVHEMDHSKEEAVRESSKIIKNNIFYLMEYRELFLALFRKFDETKQPRSFLKDLVETTHLFLKMLEKFCKGKQTVVVQKRRVKRKKKKSSVSGAKEVQPKSTEELAAIWTNVSEQLTTCIVNSENLPDSVVPFDAASEIPVEEQRAEALVRIQDGLFSGCAAEALVLLRSAREVWPEGDVFGAAEIEPEEETELLKQILFAELPRSTQAESEVLGEEEEEDEIEEEELTSVQVSEREFNFLDYMKRFANSNVVKTYVLLLKNYQQNSAHTNHCVAKMLHRIAYDLKMEALLFQLSVFCIFNKILGDPAASAYKELVAFSKYILNKFFSLAATNNKAYVELLFWKNTNVIREMTEGYRKLGEEESEANRKRIKWTPEDEDELRRLYLQFKEIEDADVVDNIVANLKPGTRTRKQVINHLVQMGLADSVKDFKQETKGTRIVLWTEDQELELQRLYEDFKDSDDILGNIMKNVTAKRSKARIIEKLISMGLVCDRKELYKKRRKKGKSSGMSEEEFLNDLGFDGKHSVDDVEEEEEEEEEEASEEEEECEDLNYKQIAKEQTGGRMDPFTDKNIKHLVHKLQQEGLSGPLLWLQNCLNRTAEDREEDGSSQAIPLVPLTEDNEDAMENKTFKKLLKKLGIRAPANEQESFWRIPGKLSPEQLRKAASCLVPLAAAVACEVLANAEEQEVNVEQRAEALRALLLARKKKSSEAQQDLQEENQKSPDKSLQSQSKTRRPKTAKKRSKMVDSDEENSVDNTNENKESEQLPMDAITERETKPNRPKKSKKRSRIVDSDDDSVTEEHGVYK
ncbi:hypothetical protein XENTR_v10006654 [Xenopus tropicalis]|nr:hypothetical protein XENTR_v10006654 [Xenopus tropicalis]